MRGRGVRRVAACGPWRVEDVGGVGVALGAAVGLGMINAIGE